jgi:shikimate kinase
MSRHGRNDNVILIGMPGAGKSTVGVILAKRTSRDFIDSDVLIQTRTGRTLQDIVDRDGYMALRRIEEEILLGLDPARCVLATGGSAAYSERAMLHLKRGGAVCFLDVAPAVLLRRVTDYATRGLAKRRDQSFEDLFRERYALYTRYADIVIRCAELDQEAVCTALIRRLDARS